MDTKKKRPKVVAIPAEPSRQNAMLEDSQFQEARRTEVHINFKDAPQQKEEYSDRFTALNKAIEHKRRDYTADVRMVMY